MREVSGQLMTLFQAAAELYGLRMEDLTAQLEVPSRAGQWMDWEIYAELIERLEAATGPEALHEVGRHTTQMGFAGPLQRIARIAHAPQQLYRVGLLWMAPLLLRRVRLDYAHVGRDHLRVTATIPADLRDSRGWFRVVQGALEGLPQLIGLPRARVVLDLSPRRGVYDVWVPARRPGLLRRLQAALWSPAFDELERQMDELQAIDRERDLLERELRERERMLSNLIENLSGLIYRCTASDFRFTFASEQSTSLLGYRPRELLALPGGCLDLVHPDDRQAVRAKRTASLATQKPCSVEYRVITRQGEIRWVLDVARPVYEGGAASAMEGFLTDVTAKKGLEEQLHRALRNEGLGRLAGGIAHDFNNLLGVILMLVDLSRSRLPADSPVQEFNQQIGAAAQRAAGLTRQLLAFARKQPIAPRVINLTDLVASMEALLQRTLMEDIKLTPVLERDLWNVEVDPGQFEQVLLNLAINARDAMKGGGRLTIETSNLELSTEAATLPGVEPGQYVVVRISDTGEGMSEEVQRRAFEPFFTTKEVGKGTGLGLASAQGIVQQAGGHIFVNSSPGTGTTFRICLPRIYDPPTSAAPGRLTSRPRHAIRECILVVEDHDALRRVFVEILEVQGYRVLDTRGAADARHVFAKHGEEIDLLVTDVVMPVMTGPELANEVLARLPGLPVLYVSGYSEHELLRDHPPHSPVAFLAKPFTPAELTAEVRSLLDISAARRRACQRPSSQVLH